ncbi:MAG: VanW family protein [Nocardioides sp.]|uniref:VanW family protein n=1 Tax=Nocardioides sp. TaxID=35761 RepID=UPI0039E64AC3
MPSSPPVKERAGKERAGGGLVALIVLALALVIGGAWVAAYLFAGDRLRHGTTLAGVEIGDKTPEQAVEALDDALADRIDEPITVTAGTRSISVDPADAGLSFDADASLAQGSATRSWNPATLWQHYTGGGELDPVIGLDDAKLAELTVTVNAKVGTAATNGTIRLRGGQVRVVDPVAGRGVEADELGEALRSAYLSTSRKVTLDLHAVAPAIDDDAVAAAVDEIANPAMSGPVTLVFGKSPVRLSPAAFGRAITFTADGGKLTPTVDRAILAHLLRSRLAADASEPVDATVTLVAGKPRVVPAKPGVTFEPARAADALLTAMVGDDGHRRVRVKASVAEPEVTTADARAWGITQKVSEFTTYFPYAEYRNINIGRAAELVDGTVLKPGETFSLNQTVGERTRENGFTEGWTIQGGIFRSDLGGGVSQLATTTFNAMFFAGLADVEHKPHSLYIDRYPIGREATVAWPTVDLKFRNDTSYGVLIHSWVDKATPSSQGSVTVQMYSTKVWDITTKTGERYDYTGYGQRTVTDGNCETTSGASGFSIDVWRYFHKPGSSAVAKTERFHTVYTPQDQVTCTG